MLPCDVKKLSQFLLSLMLMLRGLLRGALRTGFAAGGAVDAADAAAVVAAAADAIAEVGAMALSPVRVLLFTLCTLLLHQEARYMRTTVSVVRIVYGKTST